MMTRTRGDSPNVSPLLRIRFPKQAVANLHVTATNNRLLRLLLVLSFGTWMGTEYSCNPTVRACTITIPAVHRLLSWPTSELSLFWTLQRSTRHVTGYSSDALWGGGVTHRCHLQYFARAPTKLHVPDLRY